MVRLGSVSVALLMALLASRAFGQSQPIGAPPIADRSVEEARALFVAGAEAARASRWADALSGFTRSYELSLAPSALFNAGLALRALGRDREARDTLRRLLRVHGSETSAELRRDAEGVLRDVTTRVAALDLRGLPPEQHGAVFVDGRPLVDAGVRPFRVELDAGAHTIAVDRQGFETFRWEGSVGPGERRFVDVRFVPSADAHPARARRERRRTRHRPPSSSGLLDSPLFWVITGVIVTAGAAAGGYYLLGPSEMDPQSSWPVHL